MCDVGDKIWYASSCQGWYDARFVASGTYPINPNGTDRRST